MVSAKEADLALLSLFSKWTLYLSFFFASPRYVEDGLLVIVSPASRILAVVDVPLKIAYSVLSVLIFRSYSRAHISTWSQSSYKLCLVSSSSTRSSAYSRQFILSSPCSLSPVPCLLSLLVSCSGMRLKSSGEDTAPCLTPRFTCHSLSGIPFSISLLVSFSYISCSIDTASAGYAFSLRMWNS